MAKLLIRSYEPSDRGLVIQSFVMTYRGSPYAAHAPPGFLARLVENMLDTPGWKTSVACSPEGQAVILGWVTFRPPTDGHQPALGWLQVRRQWRRRGVGRALVDHAGVNPGELDVATMVRRVDTAPDGEPVPTITELAERRGLTLRFRPYLPFAEGPHGA